MKSIILISILMFGLTVLAYEPPSSFTYQGKIYKSNGIDPVDSNAVTFNVQLRSPDGSCLLFEETHFRDMSGSEGFFTLMIGEGTNTNATNLTLKKVFDNSAVKIGAGGCMYTPASGDYRRLRFSYDDGSAVVSFPGDQTIRSVPYAINSMTLDGLDKNSFLQVSSQTTQTKLDAVFTNYTELLALLNGTSSQYSKSSDLPVSGGVLNLSSGGVKVPDTPASSDMAINKNYADGKVAGKAVDISSLTDGKILSWDASSNKWVTLTPSVGTVTSVVAGAGLSGGTITNSGTISLPTTGTSGVYTKVTTDAYGRVTSGTSLSASDVVAALGYTPFNKTGDSFNGSMDMNGNNIINTGYITMAAGKYLALGSFDTAAETVLIAGTLTPGGVSYAGTTWFNRSTNTIKYWDGAQAIAIASSSAASHTFATGSAGSSPAWSHSGNAHTLNIPLASTNGVTSGLISYSDFVSFSNKQVALGYTPLDRAGTNTMAADLNMSPDGGVTTYKIVNLKDPSLLQDAVTKKYADTRVAGQWVDLTGLVDGRSLMWDSTLSKWITTQAGTVTSVTAGAGLSGGTITGMGTISLPLTGTAGVYSKVTTDVYGRVTSGTALSASDIVAALGYTPFNKAGDTYSGPLNMNGNNITNTGYITMNSGKYLGLGSFDTTAETLLVVGTLTTGGASYAGTTWYNRSTNTINYWDGTQVVNIASGNSANHTFAVGTSGASPSWSNSGNAHTLNVPMASTVAVTAGLLSYADYVSFSNKQSALGYTPLDRAGGNTMAGDLDMSPDAGVTLYKIANLKDPSALQDAVTKKYADSKFLGQTTDTTGLADGKVMVWDATNSKWKTSQPSTGTVTSVTAGTGLSGGTITSSGTISLASVGSAGTYAKVTTDAYGRVTGGSALSNADITSAMGYTPVNKAGDTISGNLTVNGNISVGSGKYVGLGGFDNTAETTLVTTLTGGGSAYAGVTWFNTSTGVIKYWDGSSAVAVSSSGSSSLTFAVGSAGSSPAWSSSGNTRTINLPMASTNGVTGGLLSYADYTSFSGKQSALGYTPLDRAGTNTMAANLNMSPDGGTTTYKLVNVKDPTSAQDAATKNYADANVGGVKATVGSLNNTTDVGKVLTWSGTGFGWVAQAISMTASQISGLGTAAFLNVGSGANAVVQLDSNGKMPAVDGSAMTGIPIPFGNVQTYDSSGTFTAGATTRKIYVQIWGGGGGGAGGTLNTLGGSGGGAGGYAAGFITVTPNQQISFVVGAGGTGGVAGGTLGIGTVGGAGGQTTFSTLIANGGSGGALAGQIPVIGGTATGDITISGGTGDSASGLSVVSKGGSGGSAGGGGGAGGAGSSIAGTAGAAGAKPGGGGGGAGVSVLSGGAGGAGGSGRVIVWW